MNVADIHTINWQMSLKKPDTIVEGRDDIEQCINTILKTRKGEDPLRPHFGCGIADWVDAPVNTRIPNMKKEILDALKIFEPRITVKSLTASVEKSDVTFNIGYETPDGELAQLGFSPFESEGPAAPPLVLSATYQDGAYRYYISLSLDGQSVLPPPPASGFASITDMMTWLNNYWYIYGAWFWVFGSKQIVLHVNPNTATSGSLNIVSDTNVLTAVFPPLNEPTDSYALVFKDDNGDRITPFNDTANNTKGQVLNYAQSNYGNYGTWSIDGDSIILNGSIPLDGYTLDIEVVSTVGAFSDGFNEGFEI